MKATQDDLQSPAEAYPLEMSDLTLTDQAGDVDAFVVTLKRLQSDASGLGRR